MENRFYDILALRFYAFLGRAVVTTKSVKTGKHYTFKFYRSKNNGPLKFYVFIKFEWNKYGYMGHIINNKFFLGKSPAFSKGTVPYKALTYLLGILWQSTTIPSVIEIYRENRCGRCRKSLTDPISIERGIGPECYKYISLQGIM